MGDSYIYFLVLITKLKPDFYKQLISGDRDQGHPHWKEMQKSKTAVWGGLTNSCEKKKVKSKEKGKIYPFECRVPKNSKKR